MDEPTNDMDTDMLAAIEDLLDSWPGTLVVVSHDRYLLERVTDNQYAILNGRLRHLPGGVDEYLRLAASAAAPTGSQDAGRATVASVTESGGASAPTAPVSRLSGAEKRNAEKELAAADRKIAKLQGQIDALHVAITEHDPADYEGIGVLHDEVRALETQQQTVETRWLELGELLA
jgi:DNA repair exonuclease SbcCD ATPase subunit